MKSIIVSLFIIFFCTLKVNAQQGKPEKERIDTVKKTLYNLANISTFYDVYPYEMLDVNFYYFEFEKFKVGFYDCGYAFYTGEYVGEHPKDFFQLLNENPKHKEIKTGSKLKFYDVSLKSGNYRTQGKPFVILIVDEEPTDWGAEDDSYDDYNYDNSSDDDYWDQYEQDQDDYGDYYDTTNYENY